MAHFGEKLRELIDKKNLDQTLFAELTGLSRKTISNALNWPIFKGEKSTYRAFAKALDITPEQLDAAWKGDAADPAAPANTQGQEEKKMNLIDIHDIAKLSFEECDVLQGAIARRMKQIRPDSNSRTKRSARTHSETA